MAKMKKTYLEQMGLEPVRHLNKKICRDRVTYLQKKIKGKAFKGALLAKAKYYVNWYGWMAENGGHRGEARKGA